MQQNYHPQQNYPQQPPPNNNALIGLVWIGAAIAMGIMLFILGFLSIGLAWCLLPFTVIPFVIGIVYLVK